MRRPELGRQTRDHQEQKRTAEGFCPRLLLLHLGGVAVALDERFGKGFPEEMAPLRRDDDQAPGRDPAVIRL